MFFRSLVCMLAVSLLLSAGSCQHHPSEPNMKKSSYQLVYNLFPHLYLINDDGTGRRLLTGGSGAKWSPQEDRIAFFGFTDRPGYFLCTIRSDGSNFRAITLATREGETLTGSLDWSPSGKQVVFFTTKYHSSGGFAVVTADGSNEISLTPEGFWRVANWSPDGSKIALEGEPAPVGKRPSIYMVNPDGTGIYNLIDAFAVYPLWRPDGRKIAFGVRIIQNSSQQMMWEMYVSNPDGSDVQRLTDDGKLIVTWSPDGSKLLYQFRPVEIENPGLTSIGIMNADGSEARVLLEADEYHGFTVAKFSPDGRKIAYVKLNKTGTENLEELWVMTANGSERRKLDVYTNGLIFYGWSPR